VNECGKNYNCQPKGFFIIFFKNGPTIMAPVKKTKEEMLSMKASYGSR
jgi:hypothetical protein